MAKIGILNLTDSVGAGGVFHYVVTLIEGLRRSGKHDYVIFYRDPGFGKFCQDSENCRPVFIPSGENRLLKTGRKIAALFDLRLSFGAVYDAIRDNKIDLLIDPGASFTGTSLNVPIMTVVFDLMHRHYPGFPEYSLKTRFIRDLIYKRAVRYSMITIVDSDQTKKDLGRFYGADTGKVRIIPYCPPWHVYRYKDLDEVSVNDVVKRYDVPEKFIFYPAQFWHHKNHLRLIKALQLLRDTNNTVVPAVFVGSQRKDSKQTFSEIARIIEKLDMRKQIFCLGYVLERELVALYKKATALVFPSLIGPTNVPPLEAMILGTPVLCSNLFSASEQIGDAGLLFDPFNVEDMAEKIYRVWVDANLRRELVKKGERRIKEITPGNHVKQWEQAIEEALDSVNA